MKLARYCLPLAAALCLTLAQPAQASPSFLGPSGNLFTPSNAFLPEGGFNAGFHMLVNVDRFGGDELRLFKGNYGVSDRLEAGLTIWDRGGGAGREILINGKYLIFTRDEQGVDVSVGITDLLDSLGLNPGLYIYLSADMAEMLGLTPGTLELGAGVGSGFHRGFFANGQLQAANNLSLFAEFLGSARLIAGGATFNVGARLLVGPNLTIDGGLFDLRDFGVGLTYSTDTQFTRW